MYPVSTTVAGVRFDFALPFVPVQVSVVQLIPPVELAKKADNAMAERRAMEAAQEKAAAERRTALKEQWGVAPQQLVRLEPRARRKEMRSASLNESVQDLRVTKPFSSKSARGVFVSGLSRRQDGEELNAVAARRRADVEGVQDRKVAERMELEERRAMRMAERERVEAAHSVQSSADAGAVQEVRREDASVRRVEAREERQLSRTEVRTERVADRISDAAPPRLRGLDLADRADLYFRPRRIVNAAA